MDIKEKVLEIIEDIKKDKNFAAKFKKDPMGTVEKLVGIDLPQDKVEDIVKAVKAKVDFDKLGDMLDSDGDGKLDLDDVSGAIGKLGGLFGKK